MPRRIHLKSHLTDDELQRRYRAATDPVERSHWHFLWLLASRIAATAVAAITGYSANWVGQIAWRYNTEGPDGVRDRRQAMCAGRCPQGDVRRAMCAGRPDLPVAQLSELGAAVAG